MPKILCIETSGPVCSVAIFQDFDVCVDIIEGKEEFKHAAVLTVLIEKILQENEMAAQHLDAIALSAGPGSYTGLRIGTSVAKGLCYALDIPLIAISTLKLMAYGFASENEMSDSDLICSAIDARRDEVYTSIYDNNFKTILKPQPLIINEESFKENLTNTSIHFVGSGAKKIIDKVNNENAILSEVDYLSAKYLGNLAMAKWKQEMFETIAYFDPFYLKEFHTTAKKKSQ